MAEDGGINLYGYVEQDPVNEYDPLGLCKGCYTVRIEVTGYDNGYGSTGKNPGDPGYGETANQTTAGPGTVAAPPNYSYGTSMTIPGYGIGVVEDRGGAIKNNHIDTWYPNDKQANNWGKRYEDVLVCPNN